MSRADEILSADDIPKREVEDTADWGPIWVRGLTLNQAKAFEGQETDSLDTIVSVVIASACDEGGNLIFAEQHREPLKAKYQGNLRKVFRAALSLNGLLDETRAIEDAVKN